jgi:hypothetical protein
MTAEERQEIRELFNDCTLGIKQQLTSIENHLAKQNSTVAKHEEKIQQALEWRAKKYQEIDDKFKQYDECMKDVEELVKDNIGVKALKKYNTRLFAVSTTILGLLIAAVGVWIKTGQ